MAKMKDLGPSNNRRARDAYNAVKQHTSFKNDPPNTLPTYIADMLANLMHLCDQRGIDFKDRLRMAEDHYTAEQ